MLANYNLTVFQYLNVPEEFLKKFEIFVHFLIISQNFAKNMKKINDISK